MGDRKKDRKDRTGKDRKNYGRQEKDRKNMGEKRIQEKNKKYGRKLYEYIVKPVA